MTRLRRSGRVSREIPIILLGTDTSGRIFSEQTKTLVLSLHGAGILSRYKFAPDEVLTLRLPDSNREAEIRLVGSLGAEPRGYVYGVTFCDPDLDFGKWNFRRRNTLRNPRAPPSNVLSAVRAAWLSNRKSNPTSSSSASPFFAFAIPADRQHCGGSPRAM